MVRNGLVGDTVFVTPVLRRLRENFPNAKLDVAVSEKSAILLKNYSYVDAIHSMPTSLSVVGHSIFFFNLRKFHYDIVVVQETNSHYALMARLAGGRFLVGFKNSLDFLMDLSIRWPSGVHAVTAELETIRGWTNELSQTATELPVTDEEIREAQDLLQATGIKHFGSIVCVHPGCNSKNSEKEWEDSYYAELSDSLIQNQKVEILFEGVEAERELIERIISKMNHQPLALVGITNLRQVLGVLKLSRVVVGSDTGTLHLANAVGTPVVMLFGHTDPVDTGPFDPSGRSIITRVNLPCIGCVHRSPSPPQWEICKKTRPVLCMEKLSPEVVYHAVSEVLNMKNTTNLSSQLTA